MTNRKFYEIQVLVTVLSEEPFSDNINLNDLHDAITEGACSGVTEVVSQKELNGEEIAEALRKQGSDPEFFQIDSNGNDLNHEETIDEFYDRKYREEINMRFY